MKPHRFLSFQGVLVCLFLVMLGACASAPPPSESPPEPPPAVQRPAAEPESPSASGGAAERKRALEAMDKAMSIKAEVAVKDLFDAAQKALDEGDARAAAASAEDGGPPRKYLEAEEGFLAAYDSAYAKREEALRQLQLARDAIKSVEEDAAAYEAEARDDDGEVF
jgi:hypothetical protein